MKQAFLITIISLLTTSYLFGTQPFITAFGDKIVTKRNDQISLMFQYNVPTDLLNISTPVSTGSVTQGTGLLRLNTGTASDGSVTVSSKNYLHYSPGHEGEILFTAAWPNGSAANSQQFIGLIDDNDGWALGYNGTTFSILFRRFSGTDSFIPQSSFNLDPLDGSGPSGFTIDTTKINVFRISYGWLGVASVTFQLVLPNGTWIAFHRIEYPNTETTPHLENPSLPIRAFVANSGNTTDLQLRTICWNATIGGEDAPARQFIVGNEGKTINSTSDQPIITIRNKTTFPPSSEQENKTLARVIVGVVGVEQNRQGLFQYYKNATLTGASYTDVNSSQSTVEYDTSATAFSGGALQFATTSVKQAPKNIDFKRNMVPILLNPGETLTVTGRRLEANFTTNVFIVWEEVI